MGFVRKSASRDGQNAEYYFFGLVQPHSGIMNGLNKMNS